MKIKIRIQDRVLYNSYICTDYSYTIGEPLGPNVPHPGNVIWLCVDSSIGFNFEIWMKDTFGDTIPYAKLSRVIDGSGYGKTQAWYYSDELNHMKISYDQVFYGDNAKLVFSALCRLNEAYLKSTEANTA